MNKSKSSRSRFFTDNGKGVHKRGTGLKTGKPVSGYEYNEKRK